MKRKAQTSAPRAAGDGVGVELRGQPCGALPPWTGSRVKRRRLHCFLVVFGSRTWTSVPSVKPGSASGVLSNGHMRETSKNVWFDETVRQPGTDQALTYRVQGIPPGGGRDSARLIRFCGLTRIMPWRGESMSAMSMNAMETTSGRIGSNLDPALALREP